VVFILQNNTVKPECILTGVIREEGAKEYIRAELERLSGGWRDLKMMIFIAFIANEKLFGL
jgi:hypothetical protein